MPFLRYKSYLNKLPYAVFVCDKNFKVLYYNDTFIKIFRPDGRRALIGKIIGCSENYDNCGKNVNCKYCHLRRALENAGKSALPAYTGRIIKKVSAGGSEKQLYFNMTVKRVGRHFMALIEDSLEMNLYNQLMAARSIQQKMLPSGENAAGKNYFYLYMPGGAIGGDLLDVFEAQGLACGFVADVSGRGIGAAMLSSFIKTAYDRKSPLLSKALIRINEKYKELKTDEREYITMLAVAVNPKDRTVLYASAGHSVPLLIKKQGKILELAANSPPISNWFDYFSYTDLKESYNEGDTLALITDGAVETKNARGERFGLKRVKGILAQASGGKEFTDNLQAALTEFKSGPGDDITALAFDL